MPLSERLTRSTSEACSSTERFLWMTPKPPCCAIAMASRDSVTVSIAALASGTASRMFRVSRVEMSTFVGPTSAGECRGSSRTSSNGSAVADSAPAAVRSVDSVFSSIDTKKGRRMSAQADADWQRASGSTSRGGPVALLVFLPAAARARIVASDFRPLMADRLHRRIVAADSRRLLLRGGRARRRGGRRAGRSRRTEHRRGRGFGARIVEDQRRAALRCTTDRRRRRFLAQHRPQPPQVADDLLVDAILHRLEQLEAFLLVLDERIALPVAAQPDAFLQVIEAVQVILPLLVDNLQHDVALDPLQDLAADQLFLVVVGRDALLPELVADLVGVAIVEVEVAGVDRVDPLDLAPERVEVPLLEIGLPRRV